MSGLYGDSFIWAPCPEGLPQNGLSRSPKYSKSWPFNSNAGYMSHCFGYFGGPATVPTFYWVYGIWHHFRASFGP